jgi:hypothetical protein
MVPRTFSPRWLANMGDVKSSANTTSHASTTRAWRRRLDSTLTPGETSLHVLEGRGLVSFRKAELHCEEVFVHPATLSSRSLGRNRWVASIALLSLVGALLFVGLPVGLTRAGAVASAPRCTTSELVVWINTSGSAAAGSEYYDLEFTNLSPHSCTLYGYPGISAVNLFGAQLGRAAGRDSSHALAVITLASGAAGSGLGVNSPRSTATAVLQVTDTGVFTPTACKPRTAGGLRVYPPSQRSSKVVPFPLVACSLSGPVYLHVASIQKGIVNG